MHNFTCSYSSINVKDNKEMLGNLHVLLDVVFDQAKVVWWITKPSLQTMSLIALCHQLSKLHFLRSESTRMYLVARLFLLLMHSCIQLVRETVSLDVSKEVMKDFKPETFSNI